MTVVPFHRRRGRSERGRGMHAFNAGNIYAFNAGNVLEKLNTKHVAVQRY
eukprot:COSAG04_NODE_1091_length_8331_cov_12.367954_5_plen_50_part_00